MAEPKKVCACRETAAERKSEDFPFKCPTIVGRVHTQCRKCKERISLAFC